MLATISSCDLGNTSPSLISAQVVLGKLPCIQAEDEPAKLSSKYTFAEMQFFYHVVRPMFQHRSRTHRHCFAAISFQPFQVLNLFCRPGWSATTVRPDSKAAHAVHAPHNHALPGLPAHMVVSFTFTHSAGTIHSCRQPLRSLVPRYTPWSHY